MWVNNSIILQQQELTPPHDSDKKLVTEEGSYLILARRSKKGGVVKIRTAAGPAKKGEKGKKTFKIPSRNHQEGRLNNRTETHSP